MMSVDNSVDRRDESQTTGNGNRNGIVTVCNRSIYSNQRLRLNRNEAHQAENYDDLELDFNSSLYGKLEQYLPPNMLTVARDVKIEYMNEILDRYLTENDRIRVQKHKEYRQYIISSYQPLHKEIYDMQPTTFFVPSFIKAITDNTEESFRSIISEPSPGVYTFEMLQPHFCELLLSEVERFEKWVQKAKFKIMRPNTMNKYGAVLDDFGLETMLDNLMNYCIRPLSKVFFPEVGGTSLDSHHGFVVEYGKDRDYELGFHVDDSEVTLNVCLGKQFSGGELFFRGVRCDKHVNTDTQPEYCYVPHMELVVGGSTKEVFDYSYVPGHGVLHRGRHRHGARPTTSGHRTNLLLWCRSSIFRESRKYQRDFPNWCGKCLLEKKERQRQFVEATKKELLKREGEPMDSDIP